MIIWRNGAMILGSRAKLDCNMALGHVTFNHGVEGSSPSALTIKTGASRIIAHSAESHQPRGPWTAFLQKEPAIGDGS